jgi:hypothetical protein
MTMDDAMRPENSSQGARGRDRIERMALDTQLTVSKIENRR